MSQKVLPKIEIQKRMSVLVTIEDLPPHIIAIPEHAHQAWNSVSELPTYHRVRREDPGRTNKIQGNDGLWPTRYLNVKGALFGIFLMLVFLAVMVWQFAGHPNKPNHGGRS